MAEADKVRWNQKYQAQKSPSQPIELVKEYAHLSIGKNALDLACGKGRHTLFLANQGFYVDALDISDVALKTLYGKENIYPQEVDFDTYALKQNMYHLIVCTYFLERTLFTDIIDSLMDGGILLMETFVLDEKNMHVRLNHKFLLQSGELKAVFIHACEIIFYEEKFLINSKGEKMKVASLAARKRSV